MVYGQCVLCPRDTPGHHLLILNLRGKGCWEMFNYSFKLPVPPHHTLTSSHTHRFDDKCSVSHCLVGPLLLRQGDESETVVSKVKDNKEVYNFKLQLCSTSSLRLPYSTETVSGIREPFNPETGGRV